MLRSVMRLLVVVAVCAVADVQGASLRGRAGKLSGAKAHPESARLSPVVFIPGNGGSRLEAKLSSPALARSYGCPERQGWFQLWLNVWDLLLGRTHCFAEVTRLLYDVDSRTSRTPPGVTVRVPGFGDTETVEFIDPTWLAWASGNVGSYAAPLIEHLTQLGYERGFSVRGAPYDFRLAPHHQQKYMRNLRRLVEDTYTINGNTPVTIIAHSMGGLFATYFMKLQKQSWKDKYISSVVSMNTPWLGSGLITKVYSSGFVFDVDVLNAEHFQKVQVSQETAPLMFPRLGAWSPHDVILQTPARNYTVLDRDQMFRDLGFPQAVLMYEDITTPDYEYTHPGVDFHCVYSHGVDTPFTYVYSQDPTTTHLHADIIHSEGDGTVNLGSLQGCNIFRRQDAYKTQVHTYRGPGHDELFAHKHFLKNLRGILTRDVVN